MGRYVGISISHVSVFKLCHPMDDAVATGKVNCYNYIVRLRTLLWFAETISQGYCKHSTMNPGLRGNRLVFCYACIMLNYVSNFWHSLIMS